LVRYFTSSLLRRNVYALESYVLSSPSLHDALPISLLTSALTPPIAFATTAPEVDVTIGAIGPVTVGLAGLTGGTVSALAGELERSEEHTSELQSRVDLVCSLILEIEISI